MPATLHDILLMPGIKPKVVDDANTLIEQEVASKSGISGTGLKLAYKTATTFAPGHVRHMVETLLPKMADNLQPFWADFHSSGGSDFGDYLTKRGPEVADALLTVTDARAAASRRPIIVKAYNSVRGGAHKHIEAALPRLGDLVTKYAG
ncbi:MAG TPA: hypothetical protein VGS19_04105 [Streptosporangiaceae bacterium]|nr:hypothetical protein [Streptosporangiaceae bacterium]